MVKVNVNMSTEDVSDFVSVDAGKHRAKLMDTTAEDSKNSGEPMIVWHWEIVGGDNDGRTIKSFTTLQEHALGGLKNHYEAFGYTGPMGIDTSRFHNKTAILTVAKKKSTSRETGEPIELSVVNHVSPDTTAKPAAGKPASAAKKSGSDDIPF